VIARGLPLACALLACGCAALFQENPPARGFDARNSDARAIEIADETMRAMGGRDAWDTTYAIAWTFFGRRAHLWRKRSGDVVVLELSSGRRVEMNVDTRKGRAFDGETEITDPAALAEALDRAYRQWINDSYWLAMPYKLKDTGVTLKYRGEAALPDGRAADVLVLTFEKVGVTPENKYEVYVARDTHLVEQWSYYAKASDPEPTLTTPWRDWRRYGEIRLSSDRGEGKRLGDIQVWPTSESFLASPAVDAFRAAGSRTP
jgi:hypothetical protein